MVGRRTLMLSFSPVCRLWANMLRRTTVPSEYVSELADTTEATEDGNLFAKSMRAERA